MTRRGGRRTSRPADHRQPRAIKRPPGRMVSRTRLIVCLWSASGTLVTRYDSYGTIETAPQVNVWDGVRYTRMEPHPPRAKVIHYQAAA